MIPQILLKKFLLSFVKDIFFKMFDQQALIWKFRENNDYRELPNEADRGVEVLKNEMDVVKSELKDAHKTISDMNNFMNKVKNKSAFKKLFR
tara:strand:+ start:864 stop:1139 length:276 start_codon:yes stop_codon:yes gene_type:complete